MKKKKRLGDLLKECGHLTPIELENIIEEQKGKAIRLGELLLERDLIQRRDLIPVLEEATHYRYIDCRTVTVAPGVLRWIPHSLAIKHCSLPLYHEEGKLAVVMAAPQSLNALDEMQFVSGKQIAPYLGFEREIREAIARWYAKSPPNTETAEERNSLQLDEKDLGTLEFFNSDRRESELEANRELAAELRKQRTPATRVVSSVLATAVTRKASDIHIDPQEKRILIRLRIDGILRDLMELPKEHQGSVISRIKILADMDIAERRVPQDGRFLVKFKTEKLDLRVATLPTQYGEKVVIRLLDPKSTRVSFRDLGFSQEHEDHIVGILSRPQGMLLVTGPTGSGKTTTLYAALNALRARPVNIITLEDPIEYVLEGINQVQVNIKSGRSFAGSLRSVLRQDPNVIMVGEIRDSETAEIALTASQTGHLLLSTVHTNDSVSAITRLIDLNIPSFLIASSITGIIAQRLVRRLCSCRCETEIPAPYAKRLEEAGISDFEGPVYAPVGCYRCDRTGYKGRLGVFEVLILDEELRNLIRNGASPDHIRDQARNSGLHLLQDEVLGKARLGLTSLDEIFRAIPFTVVNSVQCPGCSRTLSPDFRLCPYCGTARPATRSKGQPKPVISLSSKRG